MPILYSQLLSLAIILIIVGAVLFYLPVPHLGSLGNILIIVGVVVFVVWVILFIIKSIHHL